MTSRWLWGGVVLALLIWLPNLVWQMQHGFISVLPLSAIHARDSALGRTRGSLPEQLYVSANPLTIPLWTAGLWFYLLSTSGRSYRLLGWLYAMPFLTFLTVQGRSHYLGPAYPMLLSGGAVVVERWLAAQDAILGGVVRTITSLGLASTCAVGGALSLPIAPVQSGLWNLNRMVQHKFIEEIGWPEVERTMADIYRALPTDSRATTAILTGTSVPHGLSRRLCYTTGGRVRPPIHRGLVTFGLLPARRWRSLRRWPL